MNTEHDFLIIRKQDIAALASMEDLLQVAAQALRKTSSKIAVQDVRRVIELPDAPGACRSVMYAAIADQPLFGAKVLSVLPGNFAHGLPSHRGVIVLFERSFGRPVCLIDGGEAIVERANFNARALDQQRHVDVGAQVHEQEILQQEVRMLGFKEQGLFEVMYLAVVDVGDLAQDVIVVPWLDPRAHSIVDALPSGVVEIVDGVE